MDWGKTRRRRLAGTLTLLSVMVGFAGSLQTGLPESPVPLVLDSSRVLAQARAGGFDLILDSTPYHFQVEPHPIALGAVYGLDGVDLGRITETVTFAGTANGMPALVAATQVGVWVAVLGPDPLIVEPLFLSQPGAPRTQHRVLLWSENPPILPDHPEPGPMPTSTNPVLDATEIVMARNRTARLLIESDFEFYNRFNPSHLCDPCWIQAQQAVMLIAEFNLRRDAHIRFDVTSQWACTSVAACPYSTDPPNNEMGTWLSRFKEKWDAISTEPDHDLGFLLISTDLPLLVGIGYQPGEYAVSEFGTISTAETPLQYVTPTHEIGHNLNATHARAAPVPPLLNPLPPSADGKAWTVMKPGERVRLQFSDGTHTPSLNNLDRILSEAAQRLPP